MLILRRKIGERIVFGSNIWVTVAGASANSIRLAIDAPIGVSVLRGEVYDAIVAANAAAIASHLDDVGDAPQQLEVDEDDRD